MKTFVISDIHGCRKTFQAFLDKSGINGSDKLIINGDVIDRGPDSKKLVDDLLKLKNLVFLKGNHEDFLLRSYKEDRYFDTWVYPPNGGDKTLRSYGVEPYIKTTYGVHKNLEYNKSIPDDHWTFLRNGLLTYETKDFVIVHASLDFSKDDPIKETPEETKLWNRRFQYDGSKIDGRFLIVGHTPTNSQTIAENILNGFSVIYIDNGCVFKNELGFGNLFYFVLETREFGFITNCE